MKRKLGVHSGYVPPEPLLDVWLVAAADAALHAPRLSGEEVRVRLGLKPPKPRKEWRRGANSMSEGATTDV